jgi:hypothetical protein
MDQPMKPPIGDAEPEVANVPDSGKGAQNRKPASATDAQLFAQIVGLERRTARGRRDSIDHAPGAHDDVANAAAGVVAALASSNYEYEAMDWVDGPDRRSKLPASEGDDRWTGNSVRPSLHNISVKRSIDSIFDE